MENKRDNSYVGRRDFMLFIKPHREVGKISRKPIEDMILDGVKERLHKINIISALNNKEQIFNKVFNWCFKENKKILYIINTDIEDVKILGLINRSLINCIEGENDISYTGKVNICTHSRALYLKEKFDFIIYDEINSRPRYSRESINKIMKHACNSYGTMVSYSMEPIFNKELTLYNLRKDRQVPLVEPRVIVTRMNIEEEIPMGVYEYLKWSINTNRKVIIYAPDDKKANNVYKCLCNLEDKLTKNIFKNIIGVNNKKELSKFLLSEYGILVTNDFNENYSGMHPLNVMIFFADDDSFDYKDLVYISSKVNRRTMFEGEEVIFICNNETKHMDRCKNILRELNKRAWEEGVLKL
jgi:late competence protein required for DNA uptake (superfamily II DNA/RNA helicase)